MFKENHHTESFDFDSLHEEHRFIETDHDDREKLLEEALNITMPNWPLQNAVAVNPFWKYKNKTFSTLVESLEKPLGCSLMLSLDDYLKKLQSHEISMVELSKILIEEDIAEANTGKFIEHCRNILPLSKPSHLPTYIEHSYGPEFFEMIHNDLCKHLMSFFDRRQSLVQPSDNYKSFWDYWNSSQQFDSSMYHLGFPHFIQSIRKFSAMDSKTAIFYILQDMSFPKMQHELLYLQTLLGHILGWMSHFEHSKWQEKLGYDEQKFGEPLDALAVFLVYEYGTRESTSSLQSFKKTYTQKSNPETLWSSKARYIFQTAWERTIQNSTVQKLNTHQETKKKPWCEMVFCIDVRSEMIRRSIESQIPGVKTKGFAGFFGLPLDLKSSHHKGTSHRLPVLLSPSYQLKTHQKASKNTYALQSFIKHTRKLPYSSFFYVELFGILSAWKLLKDSVGKLFMKTNLKNTADWILPEGDMILKSSSGQPLEDKELAQRCHAVLSHLGMTRDFSDVIILVGHTSRNSNNAFQSSLTCGACGGHGGELNAQVLARLLNDETIRLQMQDLGIHIPETTHFLAAIHETVTDRIIMLPHDDTKTKNHNLKELEEKLLKASNSTALERKSSRTQLLDITSEGRKAFNWSEVRPEWGLAGNHSFIVAPRWRTENQNFSSRTFLHDYDWSTDKDFATLELIMTAPMIVTHWINMQYYISVVAPKKFSAGTKTLHNIFGESGVLQGNGGDLSIGLPLESIHDGEKFVHDPLRLTVYIEAPQNAIEAIIAKHENVRDLIDNQWLALVQIDSECSDASRRVRKNVYKTIKNSQYL